MTAGDQVDFISGATRLFAIVGHPIEQVRSPEMVTAELRRRGHDALLLPMHVLPEDFERALPALMTVANLDGLVFTVPFKQQAMSLADEIGPQARLVGALNALARRRDGRWHGEMFDGLGCVEAFQRRGLSFAGKRVMILGAGGAGSAIAVAIAFEGPAAIRIHDPAPGRADALAQKVRAAQPSLKVQAGNPELAGQDILVNASPVGMGGGEGMPIQVAALPPQLVVFDVVTKPARTPLLALAERCGCVTLSGPEMILGQVTRIVDHFGLSDRPETAPRGPAAAPGAR